MLTRRLKDNVTRSLLLILIMILVFSASLQAAEIRTDITYRLRVPTGQGDLLHDLTLVPADSNALLVLRSDKPMAVFEGSVLWFADRTQIRLSIDSLRKIRAVLPTLRIVTPPMTIVKAFLERQQSETDAYFRLRPRSAKEEFATMGTLLVIALMLLLLATNRRTVAGFFSFGRMFSWIAREDPMASVRMTATSNLAYYGILVLWLAMLGTIYQFSSTPFPSFGDLVIRWLFNVFCILLLLIARLIILNGFPGLFGMRFGNGQQFGLVRVATFLALLSCVVMLISFVFAGSNPLTYKLVSGLWVVGPIIYFTVILALMVRNEPTRALHYFSYLCMSEIIPLLLFSGLLQSQANPDLR